LKSNLNSDNVTDNVTDNRAINIIKEISLNNKISIDQLAEILKVTRRTVIRDLEILKTQNIIKRIGPDKGGYWEVI
jgi:ATP-dependent DNA helicase RecG